MMANAINKQNVRKRRAFGFGVFGGGNLNITVAPHCFSVGKSADAVGNSNFVSIV